VKKRPRHPHPEFYCDFNGRVRDRDFSLEGKGSIADLQKLGLDLKSAVGRRFTFVSDDADDQGNPDDIMIDGIVIYDEQYGYLAHADGDDFYWRSQIADE